MYPRLAITMMALVSLIALGGMSSPLVTRGGDLGGPGTVTVQTGYGVWATWSVRTGTLEQAVLTTSDPETRLEIGPPPPSWFVQVDSGEVMPMQYAWGGYQIDGDQITLLHELTVPDGPSFTMEERPKSVVGPGGLLSLQRTFQMIAIGGSESSPTLIKRIRTGTKGGVTLPTKTNGRLQPLGLNDNLQADVVFRNEGPTVITTIFNGHWVDQPSNPETAKESSP